MTEGRAAVQGLRSSIVVANDLARAIATFADGLTADQPGRNRPGFGLQVEGNSRDLPPLVRDEVYHIACETLRNAFRHAQAKRIEVCLRYDPRQFRLRVVDNGKGIDPAVLSAGRRAGHMVYQVFTSALNCLEESYRSGVSAIPEQKSSCPFLPRSRT